MEKINVAEILKDCPKGMELDCLICDGVVTLEGVVVDNSPYPINAIFKGGYIYSFTEFGGVCYQENAKCVIFPKGKTTWEGFVPPCKFKDGDILYAMDEGKEFIFILKHISEDGKVNCYLSLKGDDLRTIEMWLTDYNTTHRLATEEEKQKLFQAIKDNGYRWNEEEKKLEKLEVKKFDITTLKPFESRVLVRDGETVKWNPAIWGFLDSSIDYPYVVVSGNGFEMCIPYESNEHLLGTTDDCDEYYKIWEK